MEENRDRNVFNIFDQGSDKLEKVAPKERNLFEFLGTSSNVTAAAPDMDFSADADPEREADNVVSKSRTVSAENELLVVQSSEIDTTMSVESNPSTETDVALESPSVGESTTKPSLDIEEATSLQSIPADILVKEQQDTSVSLKGSDCPDLPTEQTSHNVSAEKKGGDKMVENFKQSLCSERNEYEKDQRVNTENVDPKDVQYSVLSVEPAEVQDSSPNENSENPTSSVSENIQDCSKISQDDQNDKTESISQTQEQTECLETLSCNTPLQDENLKDTANLDNAQQQNVKDRPESVGDELCSTTLQNEKINAVEHETYKSPPEVIYESPDTPVQDELDDTEQESPVIPNPVVAPLSGSPSVENQNDKIKCTETEANDKDSESGLVKSAVTELQENADDPKDSGMLEVKEDTASMSNEDNQEDVQVIKVEGEQIHKMGEGSDDENSQSLIIDLTDAKSPKPEGLEEDPVNGTCEETESISEKMTDEVDSVSVDDNDSDNSIKGVEEIQKLLHEYVKSAKPGMEKTSSNIDVCENGNIAITLKMNSNKTQETDDEKIPTKRKISTEECWSEVGQIRCPFCLFTTDQQSLMDTHISTCSKRKDKKEEMMKCPYCFFTTDQQSVLDLHISSCRKRKEKKGEIQLKYKDGRYGCQNCLSAVALKKKFEEHVAFHLLSEPYICLRCMVTFDSKKKIELHVKDKHASETVKCGLRGSKKITSIIEILQKNGEYSFLGRELSPKHASLAKEASAKSKTSTSSEKTILSVPQVLRPLTSTNVTAPQVSRPITAANITSASSIVIQNSSSANHQNQSVPLNVTASTKPFVTTGTGLKPVLPNPMIPTVVQGVMGTSKPSLVSILPTSQPLAMSAAGVQGTIRPLTVEHAVTTKTLPLLQQPPPSQPLILIPNGNILVPVTMPNANLIGTKATIGTIGTIAINLGQNNSKSSTVPPSPPQFVNPSTNAQRLIFVQPTSSIPVITTAVPLPALSSLQQPINAVSTQNLARLVTTTTVSPVKTVSSAGQTITVHSPLQVNPGTAISVQECTKAENLPDKPTPVTQEVPESFKDKQQKGNKKLFFRKCNDKFTCDFCSYEVNSEDCFRRHVWKHFHVDQNICKACPLSSDATDNSCNLVVRVMDGLHSAAEIAAQEKKGKPVTVAKTEPVQGSEILISDDENDIKAEEEDHSGLSDIKILSTYSLSVSFNNKTTDQENQELGASDDGKKELGASDDDKKQEPTKPNEPSEPNDAKSSMESVRDKIDSVANDTKQLSEVIESNEDIPVQSSSDSALYPVIRSLINNQSASDKAQTTETSVSNTLPTVSTDSRVVVNSNSYFYQCGFEGCGFGANTSSDYKDHLGIHHPYSVSYRCVHCGHNSVTDELHMRHVNTHSKPATSVLFLCGEGCKFGTNLLCAFREHLLKVHPSLLDYKCASCKHIFTKPDDLIAHLESNKLQFVLCPHCSFKDKNRRIVMKHLSECHPGKPRQITVTSQLVCQDRELNDYMTQEIVVTKPKETVLEHTTSTATVPSIIEMEATKQSGEEISEKLGDGNRDDSTDEAIDDGDMDMSSTIISNTETSYKKCPKCSYITSNNSGFSKHLSLHSKHPDKTRLFICPICSAGLDKLPLFSQHMRHHEGYNKVKVYICFHCSYQTNQNQRIIKHGTTKHNSCVFDVDYSVRTHKYRETAFHCPDCEFIHKNEKIYKNHVSMYHGKEADLNEAITKFDKQEVKPHKDPMEELKAYKEPIEQEDDLDIEYKEKKFTCRVCKRSFDKLPQLKQHLNIHVFDVDDYYVIFRCAYCAYLSTSKHFVSTHIQEKHPTLSINVKSRKEYVHPRSTGDENFVSESASIDLLHCDCCSFSCSDVQQLAQHTKMHLAPQSITEDNSLVMQKPSKEKKTYTGPKKKFYIPQGNIFKEDVECSECLFKTKRRLDLLRHLKSHPNLEPLSQSEPNKDVNVYDISTSNLLKIKFGKRKQSGEVHTSGRPKKKYKSFQESSSSSDEEWEPLSPVSKKKQVALKSTTATVTKGKQSFYYLGGDVLHLKLRPCFTKDEQNPMFECLFCEDVFEDRYTLHRHLLQHMDISFFKCFYCDHGELETTSLVTHIQKEHKKPIRHEQIDQVVIESKINKAIHNMKAQQYWGAPEIADDSINDQDGSQDEILPEPDDQDSVNSKGKEEEIVPPENIKKEVEDAKDMEESVIPDRLTPSPLSNGSKSSASSSNKWSCRMGPLPQCIVMMGRFYKCIVCGHRTDNRTSVLKHAITHSSRKRHMCGECDYRSHWKGDVKKHMVQLHCGHVNILYDYEDLDADAQFLLHVDELKKQRPQELTLPLKKETVETEKEISKRYSCPYCTYQGNFKRDIRRHAFSRHRGMDVEPFLDVQSAELKAGSDSQENIVTQPEIKRDSVSSEKEESGAKKIQTMVGMRTFYKCLLCNQTFKNLHRVYLHLRTTKCKRNLWRCSICKKYKSDKERVVTEHVKDAHVNSGGKAVLCSKKGKIRIHKVPVNVFKSPYLQGKAETAENSAENKKIKLTESENAAGENAAKGDPNLGIKFVGDRWACVKCNYKSFCKNRVVRHLISHNDLKKFKCPLCAYRARLEISVKKHMSICHPGDDSDVIKLGPDDTEEEQEMEREGKDKEEETYNENINQIQRFYKCLECGLLLNSSSGIYKHIRKKCTSPMHGCSACNFKDLYEETVLHHIQQNHPDATCETLKAIAKMKVIKVSKNVGEVESVQNSSGNSFKLKLKPMKLKIETDSKPSTKTIKQEPTDESSEIKLCPLCKFPVTSFKALRIHFNSVHRNYRLQCLYCKQYVTKKAMHLVTHTLQFHGKEKFSDLNFDILSENDVNDMKLNDRPVILYKCGLCEHVAQRQPLKFHLYIHFDYSPYKCKYCDVSFKSLKIMKHIQMKHPGEKPDYVFQKDEKIEREIKSMLEKGRYQTVSKETYKMNETMKKAAVEKEKEEEEEEEEHARTEDPSQSDDQQEEESTKDHRGQPETKGDVKHMFSPCHNYTVDYDEKTSRTIYQCSICPYNTCVVKTITNHFYQHVPHVFKCPYCSYQNYPRSKIVCHLKKQHPQKTVHVVDLRNKMKNLKFREYEPAVGGRSSIKKQKVTPVKLQATPSKSGKYSVSSKSYRKPSNTLKISESLADVFTSEGSDDDDNASVKTGKLDCVTKTEKDGSRNGKLLYCCNQCNKTVESLYHFRQHLATHDGFTYQMPGSMIQSRLKCGYCSYLALDDNDFKRHMEKHFSTRPYSCPYCNFSQYRPSGIRNHVKSAHPSRPVDVVKDNTSSCLIGDNSSRVMLVALDPKVRVRDILAMESEDFENLLTGNGVSVIDLNFILDDKFESVSRTLGLHEEFKESGEDVSELQNKEHENEAEIEKAEGPVNTLLSKSQNNLTNCKSDESSGKRVECEETESQDKLMDSDFVVSQKPDASRDTSEEMEVLKLEVSTETDSAENNSQSDDLMETDNEFEEEYIATVEDMSVESNSNELHLTYEDVSDEEMTKESETPYEDISDNDEI